MDQEEAVRYGHEQTIAKIAGDLKETFSGKDFETILASINPKLLEQFERDRDSTEIRYTDKKTRDSEKRESTIHTFSVSVPCTSNRNLQITRTLRVYRHYQTLSWESSSPDQPSVIRTMRAKDWGDDTPRDKIAIIAGDQRIIFYPIEETESGSNGTINIATRKSDIWMRLCWKHEESGVYSMSLYNIQPPYTSKDYPEGRMELNNIVTTHRNITHLLGKGNFATISQAFQSTFNYVAQILDEK